MKYLIFALVLIASIPATAQTQSFSVSVRIVTPAQVGTTDLRPEHGQDVSRQVVTTRNIRLVQY